MAKDYYRDVVLPIVKNEDWFLELEILRQKNKGPEGANAITAGPHNVLEYQELEDGLEEIFSRKMVCEAFKNAYDHSIDTDDFSDIVRCLFLEYLREKYSGKIFLSSAVARFFGYWVEGKYEKIGGSRYVNLINQCQKEMPRIYKEYKV